MTQLNPETDKTFGDVPEGKCAMAVMGLAGDTKYFWDSGNPDEVQAAKKQFEYFTREKKYAAFHVGRDATKGEQMREFDAKAERIIFAPPMQGG